MTASTGNHALATAHALATLDLQGEIFLPVSASPVKIEGLRARGARLRLVGTDPGAVEVAARACADETGRVYVSPYNDPQVIGGQGTIATELLRTLGSIDAIFVPVGGGGLIAGIAGFLDAASPKTRVVGCQPRALAIMARSVGVGRLIEEPSGDSISDATLGLVEQGSITFPVCRACVDEWVLLLEKPDLRSAVRLVRRSLDIDRGAAALAVAALRCQTDLYRGQTVVLVVSGSHIALPVLRDILSENDYRLRRQLSSVRPRAGDPSRSSCTRSVSAAKVNGFSSTRVVTAASLPRSCGAA